MNTPENKCCDKCKDFRLLSGGHRIKPCQLRYCECHHDTPETMEERLDKKFGVTHEKQEIPSGNIWEFYSEIKQFINQEISLAISSHNKELVEKVEKDKYDLADADDEIDKLIDDGKLTEAMLIVKKSGWNNCSDKVINLIKDSK